MELLDKKLEKRVGKVTLFKNKNKNNGKNIIQQSLISFIQKEAKRKMSEKVIKKHKKFTLKLRLL